MKKIRLLLISLVICISVYSCGFTSTSRTRSPKYLCNISQQYDKTSEEHTFFWQFQSISHKAIKAKATINIKIINDKNEEVFNKDFDVDETNYSTWTSKGAPDGELLGSIAVSDYEIEEGTTDTGEAILTVEFDKGYFEPMKTRVYDLPKKGVTVILPKLPVKSDYYGYDNSLLSSVSVTDISYEYDIALKIKFTAEMNYRADNRSSMGYVVYKLTNQEGIVVAKNQVMYLDMNVGEKMVEEDYVYDVEPGDELTLTIIDYQY